ncbi:ribosome silencing factor [bacterium]|nr:ribosome silencing factor [bacterium]|tara:strand:+ start:197 stop:562 length:366 start_codon:yes stop_codon:yes gene_type:complete
MTDLSLQPYIDSIVSLLDEKKVEDIRTYFVAETSWMTDYVIVSTIKNSVHAKSVLVQLEQFFHKMDKSDVVYSHPRVTGDPNSGWIILDANSVVVHCLDDDSRNFYNIDALFEKQGNVHYF